MDPEPPSRPQSACGASRSPVEALQDSLPHPTARAAAGTGSTVVQRARHCPRPHEWELCDVKYENAFENIENFKCGIDRRSDRSLERHRCMGTNPDLYNKYLKRDLLLVTNHYESVFQVAEKMERRTCALCPKDLDYSILYFSQSENVAAHENCLLYSSALVECEDHESHNGDRSFDVESVKKEIYRGRKLTCKFCRQKGATVGCEVKSCSKSYHFFCAKSDHAVLQTDRSQGIYKVFCKQHAPKGGFQNDFSGVKRKKMKKCLSTDIRVQTTAEMTVNGKMDGTHTDAVMKVSFLKKCKEAGLLNDLFEAILDKLHSLHERLMDETVSESDYEEIGTSLFDCTLFEDTFLDFQAAIENEIHQSEERRQQLKEEIELLQDLKQTLCSVQTNRDTTVTS